MGGGSADPAAPAQGARVAVTGAASGIGAATVARLQALGWRTACLDRNLAGARAAAGADGVAIEVDVADEASVIRAFEQAGSAWAGLDALVTAAGIINTRPFFDTPVAELRQLFDVNVIGSFLSVREGAKYMQRGARVCMVASISSYTGGGYVARSAYATSKGAVLTLMKGCARELGPKGIAVNAVAPGFIDTPFVASAMSDPVRRKEVEAAVGKVGTPEQIAECIAFLVSPAASFVHGETLIADGGILMR
ncbi:MAG TPA: SDR family oxidoreductase [Gammaproteobacteria bacterium]|jgi:NAD(P)-dependent dehydrogenase (short-subunit alcohol dehydrogenase family)|nr:SDR family oxidoreductase [Gammaproteobacteria bacterium]